MEVSPLWIFRGTIYIKLLNRPQAPNRIERSAETIGTAGTPGTEFKKSVGPEEAPEWRQARIEGAISKG
jgi:hypothetical protein